MVNGVFVCLYFLKAKLIYLKYLSCMRVYRVFEYRFLYTKSKNTKREVYFQYYSINNIFKGWGTFMF